MCVSVASDTSPSMTICSILITFYLKVNSLFRMHGESSLILEYVSKLVDYTECLDEKYQK
jgi:hypothetical protein